MRYFGHRETPPAPTLPDTILGLLLTASSVQAFDWPTATDLVRVTAGSTAQGFGTIFFNPLSTSAALPTTGAVFSTGSTASSSLMNIAITQAAPIVFQRPRSSTGFSVISPTSSYLSVECWTKTGSS